MARTAPRPGRPPRTARSAAPAHGFAKAPARPSPLRKAIASCPAQLHFDSPSRRSRQAGLGAATGFKVNAGEISGVLRTQDTAQGSGTGERFAGRWCNSVTQRGRERRCARHSIGGDCNPHGEEALFRIMSARGCRPPSLETRAKSALLGMRGDRGCALPGDEGEMEVVSHGEEPKINPSP